MGPTGKAMRLSPHTGTYVSGAGHAAFILYLIVGGLFVARETDLDVEVSNVSIISGDEFAAMQPQSPGETDVPAAPQAPADVDQPAPLLPKEPDADTSTATPTAPAPVPDVAPEPDPVIETPPEPPAPAEPDGDPGATVIEPDAVPTPRPSERIAQEAAEAPDPDVEESEVEQAAVSEAPSEEVTQAEEAQEATAPQEATTEIVTEADAPSTAAPSRSVRPGRKPTPPTPQVAETPAQEPTVPGLAESVASAVAEANARATNDNANPGGGTGSPITRAEKGAFILGIQKCWNVGALGTDALAVSVVVGFRLEQDAKPIIGSINLISASGGSGSAVDRAYEAARRAIIRCGANGYDLPLDKYNQWREVQVSFNATRREIR